MTSNIREILDRDDADLRVKANEIEVDENGNVIIANEDLKKRIQEALENGDADEIAGLVNGGCSCDETLQVRA